MPLYICPLETLYYFVYEYLSFLYNKVHNPWEVIYWKYQDMFVFII